MSKRKDPLILEFQASLKYRTAHLWYPVGITSFYHRLHSLSSTYILPMPKAHHNFVISHTLTFPFLAILSISLPPISWGMWSIIPIFPKAGMSLISPFASRQIVPTMHIISTFFLSWLQVYILGHGRFSVNPTISVCNCYISFTRLTDSIATTFVSIIEPVCSPFFTVLSKTIQKYNSNTYLCAVLWSNCWVLFHEWKTSGISDKNQMRKSMWQDWSRDIFIQPLEIFILRWFFNF